MSQHPLWTFIKSSQATKLVSLRLLQQFILSLTKTELIHLIQHYLQSKLSECTACTADGLTLTQTLHLYRNEGYALPSLDQQIMSKLNNNYGKKYSKKVISKPTPHPKKTNHAHSIYYRFLLMCWHIHFNFRHTRNCAKYNQFALILSI
eukprot:638474_1